MRTMTWEEIDRDWKKVQRTGPEYVQREEAEAMSKYCIGHSIEDVAKRLGVAHKTIQNRLDLLGVIRGAGRGRQIAPLEARLRDTWVAKLIDVYGPDVSDQPLNWSESDGEKLGPYLVHYMVEGYTEDAALRLAKAEWAGKEAAWDQMYEELQAYKEEHGHSNVPHDFVTDDGLKLGSWVTAQRKAGNAEKRRAINHPSLSRGPDGWWSGRQDLN